MKVTEVHSTFYNLYIDTYISEYLSKRIKVRIYQSHTPSFGKVPTILAASSSKSVD